MPLSPRCKFGQLGFISRRIHLRRRASLSEFRKSAETSKAMVIDKSDVRMWTEKVSQTRREHHIRLKGSDETTLARGSEEVQRHDFQANFRAEEAKPEEFASVAKMLEVLKKSSGKSGDDLDIFGALRLKLLLIWMLITRLFGEDEDEKKKQPVPKAGIFEAPPVNAGAKMSALRPASTGPLTTSRRLSADSIEGETHVQTREFLFFEAHGKVTTQDGAEIPVDIRLRLEDSRKDIVGLDRDVVQSLIDPLVVNYDNDSALLTDQKFSFDLDIDGKPDNIAMPASGSAFLALDKNGDGVITDGSELFGVRSGDGFKELAAFDDDKNGFIDEGDKVYDQLRLFTRGPDGKDIVFTLREKGVEAISLENLATALRLKDGDGVLRKTGFILRAGKSASTVQHVDLRPEPLLPAQNLKPLPRSAADGAKKLLST
jgi:hypothetical protein